MKHGQKQLELTLSLSPQEAADRIIQVSDDMAIESDKDAWLSFVGIHKGHATFQHKVEGKGVYVQKRPNLRNSQHGVSIQFEPRFRNHIFSDPFYGCSRFYGSYYIDGPRNLER